MLPLMSADISVNANGENPTVRVGLEFQHPAHAAVTRDLEAYAAQLLGSSSPLPKLRRGAILIVCSRDLAPSSSASAWNSWVCCPRA